MSDTPVPPAVGGVAHILRANVNRVGNTRVDKLEADAVSRIVERISGVNPSDPWGEKKQLPPPRPQQPTMGPPAAVETVSSGGGSSFSATWGNSPAHQIAASRPDAQMRFLMEKVQMLEQRLAKYETFGDQDNDVPSLTTTPARKITRGADSSAYGQGTVRKNNAKTKDPVDGKPDGQAGKKEAPMAGEHVNILGMSMTEWRSLANLPEKAVNLAQQPAPQVAIEEEVDGEEVETAPAPVETNEHKLWAEFLKAYDTTPEAFAEFAEAAHENDDKDAIAAIVALEDEFVEAISQEPDVDQLWSEWLEAHDLSVEAFSQLIDAAETPEDIQTLENIQAMFEAEIAGKRIAGSSPTPAGGEISMPGKKPQKLQSVAAGQIKPSRKGNFSLPAAMRAKMGLPKEEEDDFFECDADENGEPNQKQWAKAMKKFSKKSGRKS
jgi:hypothetical protein